jgi:hypothetical protein
MFNSWFNTQNSTITQRNQKILQIKEYFPDCFADSVDENVVYVIFGPGKKNVVSVIFVPSFPNSPPALKLINVPFHHPLADNLGLLSPDIHPDLRNWNINKSLGRIVWEIVAELQRPRVVTSVPQHSIPEKSSKSILLDALSNMRYLFFNHCSSTLMTKFLFLLRIILSYLLEPHPVLFLTNTNRILLIEYN